MAEEDQENVEQTPPKKKGKLLLIVSVLTVILVAGGGGAAWFLTSGSGDETEGEELVEETEALKDPVYFTLADNLVVNFQSRQGTRFLQVGVNLMTYDSGALDALEVHSPVLKSDLILLLSDQTEEQLLSREGKEQLRADALSSLRSAMTQLHGEPVIEALYFTSFVMQ